MTAVCVWFVVNESCQVALAFTQHSACVCVLLSWFSFIPFVAAHDDFSRHRERCNKRLEDKCSRYFYEWRGAFGEALLVHVG